MKQDYQDYRGKALQAFECKRCGGSGEVIVDWDAHNQLGMPIGMSRAAAEQQKRYYERAYGKCSVCKGRGFILAGE